MAKIVACDAHVHAEGELVPVHETFGVIKCAGRKFDLCYEHQKDLLIKLINLGGIHEMKVNSLLNDYFKLDPPDLEGLEAFISAKKLGRY